MLVEGLDMGTEGGRRRVGPPGNLIWIDRVDLGQGSD